MKTNIRLVVSRAAFATRRERLEGREYLVVPVVPLVVGVHNGLYYTPYELAKYPDSWNGVPVTLGHPAWDSEYVSANSPEILEKYAVGWMFNVHWEPVEGKLRAEVWVDVEKATAKAPEVVSYILSGKEMEVSTGLYADDDATPGTWGMEKYTATVINYRPDHLALLPAAEGACSLKDGCGIRSNLGNTQKKERELLNKNAENTKRGFLSQTLHQVRVALGLALADESHDEMRRLLDAALRKAVGGLGSMVFIREVWDKDLVYEISNSDGSEVRMYRREYSIADGEAKLGESAEEVKEQRSFVPVNAVAQPTPPAEPIDQTTKEVDMVNKKEAIDALIACERTKFAEEHRPWLDTLTECQLEVLKAPDLPPLTVETLMVETPAEKPVTLEALIASAPPEMRDTLTRAVARDKAHKDSIVSALLANKRNKFTKVELDAKDITELETLTELAQIDVNYEGAAPAPHANKEDAAPPMERTWDLASKSA